MGDYFTQHVKTFLAELQNESLVAFRSENEEYHELCKAHAENIRKIQGMELDRVYLQGYIDCIKLLKMIHAIT